MCGIVGYIGNSNSIPMMINGLKKLEYRGYDSAGISIYNDGGLKVFKSKGRLQNLQEILNSNVLESNIGIGHTRWATHGEPCDVNSHPHLSNSGKFAVVHNGIIENYLVLKRNLINHGFEFVSETDTEVVAQLLDFCDTGDFLNTVIKVISQLEGSYSLGIMNKFNPNELIAVRKDSPLIIGFGENENYIASDIPAILSKTKKICRLNDSEIAVLKRDSVTIYDLSKNIINKDIVYIDWNIESTEKQGYAHFMLKEIMEQPTSIKNTIYPRIKNNRIILDDISMTEEYIKNIRKIYIVACGSAYHVACVAKYVFEKLTNIPVDVDLASEFRYREPLVNEKDLVMVISQSGETADSLAALRKSKKHGARVLSIVNVVGSSIANESDDVIYTWAGPEIAVATTKAYSTQLAVIYLLSIYMAEKLNKISIEDYNMYINELFSLSAKVELILNKKDEIMKYAKAYCNLNNSFFIGRNLDYAVSLEGALKLKEISYICCEAYAAGELKHGPISLIQDNTLVIAIATQDKLIDKTLSNIKEVKARGAEVFSIAVHGDKKLSEVSDHVFYIPKLCELLSPSLSIIPLQLFSYYVALNKDCDIDKPRNLAKSVTVE